MRGSGISDHTRSESVVLLGLGNILLSDEGVGVHVINAIRRGYDFSPGIEVVDGGVMGLDLLPLFQMHGRIVIVDAVDFGKTPGHSGMVPGEEIHAVLNTRLSAHHLGLSDILCASKLVCERPPEVRLIGIQPASFEVGLNMSPVIQEKIGLLIGLVLGTLRDWGIEFRERSFSKLPE